MSTTLTRIASVLARIQFPEAQEALNEIRAIQMQCASERGLQQLKCDILKAGHKEVSKAYQAIEHLEQADQLLHMIGLLNAEIRDQVAGE